MTLGITTLCHYAQCRCAECHVLFIVMLNVVMLSVVTLGVVMLNVMAPKKHITIVNDASRVTLQTVAPLYDHN